MTEESDVLIHDLMQHPNDYEIALINLPSCVSSDTFTSSGKNRKYIRKILNRQLSEDHTTVQLTMKASNLSREIEGTLCSTQRYSTLSLYNSDDDNVPTLLRTIYCMHAQEKDWSYDPNSAGESLLETHKEMSVVDKAPPSPVFVVDLDEDSSPPPKKKHRRSHHKNADEMTGNTLPPHPNPHPPRPANDLLFMNATPHCNSLKSNLSNIFTPSPITSVLYERPSAQSKFAFSPTFGGETPDNSMHDTLKKIVSDMDATQCIQPPGETAPFAEPTKRKSKKKASKGHSLDNGDPTIETQKEDSETSTKPSHQKKRKKNFTSMELGKTEDSGLDMTESVGASPERSKRRKEKRHSRDVRPESDPPEPQLSNSLPGVNVFKTDSLEMKPLSTSVAMPNDKDPSQLKQEKMELLSSHRLLNVFMR